MQENASEDVILVDARDRVVGRREKLAAHRAGELHRAFSVILWDGQNRLLLQRRHPDKYHSGGLWTNACCGHPRPDELVKTAASRRLMEEIGVATELVESGSLIYRAELDNGLVEHELVHIFAGRHAGPIELNPVECDACRWIDLSTLKNEIADTPERFTAWFKIYCDAGWPLEPPGR